MSNYQSVMITKASAAQSGAEEAVWSPPSNLSFGEAQTSTRHVTGATRTTIVNGETVSESLGVERHISENTGTEPDDVAGTARSPLGRPLGPAEIKGNSIVTVQGMTMEASQAERLGLLVKDATGVYQNATPAPKEEVKAASVAPKIESIGDAEEAIIADYVSNLQGWELHGAMRQMLDVGEADAGLLGRIASARGEEPGHVAEKLEQVRSGFEKQAGRAVENATGLDGAFALEIAQRVAPELLDNAARSQVMSGDLSGYQQVAHKVLGHVFSEMAAGRIEQDITAMDGLELRVRGGKMVVSGRDIGEMELIAAIRSGVVKIGAGG